MEGMTGSELKASFNIHGLPLEISAVHPLLFEAFVQDLSRFRVSRPSPSRDAVRLRLTALPDLTYGNGYPSPFSPYREAGSRAIAASGNTVTCYGRNTVVVLSSFREPAIRAAVLPEAELLIDPAYHYCFTQPANFWFKRRGLFFVHAGCVSSGSEGILIIGHSRAGKSTLSLCAVQAGFKFLSDEQPLLALRRGRVVAHPFPRRIRIDRAAAGLFPNLRPILKSCPSRRLVFHIEKVWPGCIASSCRPRILLFPRFQARGRLRLSRLQPSEALARLLQDDHFIWYKNSPQPNLSHQHLALFEKLARQASAHTLEYGNRDLPRIPSLFHRLLDHG